MEIPKFLEWEKEDRKAALEALIFSSEEALSLQSIFRILIINDLLQGEKSDKKKIAALEQEISERFDFSAGHIVELIDEINSELEASSRPYRIVNFAGGWQFATKPEYGSLVQQIVKSRTKRRLSQAALEVLAIVAYKQPITKPEIEALRGVNSNEVVNALIEKNLVESKGRSKAIGKPLQYGTTDDFLKTFGLASIDELPKLAELEELAFDEEKIHEMDGIEKFIPKDADAQTLFGNDGHSNGNGHMNGLNGNGY